MNFLRETSYRGLPAEFFAAAPPSPAPSPHWIVFNDALAAQLGLPEGADTPRAAGACCRAARRRRAAETSRWPIPAISSANGIPCMGDGRAAHASAKSSPPDGMRLRRPSQGVGADPVRPARRRARDAAGHAARIYRQRGHGRAEHPHDALARRGRHRRAGLSRTCPAGRRADPHRPQPCPRRHLPICRQRGHAARRRPPPHARPGRSLHRPALSRTRRGEGRLCVFLCGGGGATGAARRAMDAGGLHPRRDEHRQYVHRRGNHRFRPLRLHGFVQPPAGLFLDRRRGTLRLQPAGPDRLVEPGAACRDAAALVRRRRFRRFAPRAGDARRLPAGSMSPRSARVSSASWA